MSLPSTISHRLLRLNRDVHTAAVRTLRVACASGFWGDTAVSTPQLVSLDGAQKVDYIVYDYLSEITMSLLAGMKAKNPDFGYCPDFLHFHMKPHLGAIKKKGIRIISNAGGLNPVACAKYLQKVAKDANVDIRIAAVTGDDLTAYKDLQFDRKQLMATVGKGRLASMNAYFGAEPITCALAHGADIVITGRCVDSALVLAPVMHECKVDNVDAMATASLAGHLIECGAQVTGGISTDWERLTESDWVTMGFPIVEFDGDNCDSFVVTKPSNTGGMVNIGTVSEQLVYEIGDPQNYVLPDVVADFSNVRLEQIDDNRVRVSNTRGKPAPDQLKVTATYMSGFRCTGIAPVIGPNAVDKGRVTVNAVVKRCERIFKQLGLSPFSRVHIQLIGAEESYGQRQQAYCKKSREVMLWMAVEHESKDALQIFAREIAPAGTGMPPGLTTLVGGRPAPSPVLKHTSFLVDRESMQAQIHMDGQVIDTVTHSKQQSLNQNDSSRSTSIRESSESSDPTNNGSNMKQVRLGDVAYTRSGDKGDTANIERVVADYFAHFIRDGASVKRYELPGIYGLNFVLEHSLGGGGVASLRCDPQGKAYGQMLLDLPIEVRAN